jgi:pilus assembly protein TadC
MVYRQRYSLLDKKIMARNSGIRSSFPDFLGKLILLIRAGMVVTGALERICDGYRNVRRDGEKNALYEELCDMSLRMRASNTGLTQEFRDLAKRSGIKEVQRFSAILSDNINKGSVLSEKLARERDALWSLRKKLSEEKGKLAETKLTFPMVMQLLVIILITVAPAALQMG